MVNRIRTYYTLKDKIVRKSNLHLAAQGVLQNKGGGGVDGETVDTFKENYPQTMRALRRQLMQNRYEPPPVLRAYIPKGDGRQRPLGIPTIRDRVAQAAVRRVLEPLFERCFCDCSYGFRPGRSAHDAIQHLERYREQGYRWVVDADIKSYFDTIDQATLMDLVAERVSDGWVLDLIRSWLSAGVMTDGRWEATPEGTPQGGVISPLLANIYLHAFDAEMTRRNDKLVRYADDFVVCANSRRKAERALAVIREQAEGQLQLTLHPEKTVITNFGTGFTFLGFEFIAWRYKRPREKALRRFKDRVRELTRRQQPWPVDVIISWINPVIRGWGNYFGKGNVKKLFERLDQWIRMRVRAYVERKKAVYHQNQRIPNRVLRQKGLVSLLTNLP